MNTIKIGKLIKDLRKEQRLTQLQLATLMNISDKTISKWERGLGCPDVSILTELSNILHVDLEKLLTGDLEINHNNTGNIKNIQFYYCPKCLNLITSITKASISCCGKKLESLQPQQVTEDEKFNIEMIENDYFISSNHEMTKEHYITHIALLVNDSILIRKQYPEWHIEVRLPVLGHGTLLWHCNKHGLFYQEV